MACSKRADNLTREHLQHHLLRHDDAVDELLHLAVCHASGRLLNCTLEAVVHLRARAESHKAHVHAHDSTSNLQQALGELLLPVRARISHVALGARAHVLDFSKRPQHTLLQVLVVGFQFLSGGTSEENDKNDKQLACARIGRT